LSTVPLGYAAEQTEPQLIPEGLLVTVPGPEVVTVRTEVARLKLAVTVTGVLSASVQAAVPAQPLPLQRVNVEPMAGVAVSVTAVPDT
jgi:hypothetical protein